MFKDFRVYRASELINLNSDISNFVPTSIPDHSCLTWNIRGAIDKFAEFSSH